MRRKGPWFQMWGEKKIDLYLRLQVVERRGPGYSSCRRTPWRWARRGHGGGERGASRRRRRARRRTRATRAPGTRRRRPGQPGRARPCPAGWPRAPCPRRRRPSAERARRRCAARRGLNNFSVSWQLTTGATHCHGAQMCGWVKLLPACGRWKMAAGPWDAWKWQWRHGFRTTIPYGEPTAPTAGGGRGEGRGRFLLALFSVQVSGGVARERLHTVYATPAGEGSHLKLKDGVGCFVHTSNR